VRFRVVVWLTGWRLLTLQITIQCAFSTFHAMLVSALSRLYISSTALNISKLFTLNGPKVLAIAFTFNVTYVQ
jgi:hypothetical protein